MSGVSQNNNTTPSPNNGHNGHSLRDMLPETFTLLDLMALRKQNVTVSADLDALFDSDYSEEEEYYFRLEVAEYERWEEERAMRHEERQHPGVKYMGIQRGFSVAKGWAYNGHEGPQFVRHGWKFAHRKKSDDNGFGRKLFQGYGKNSDARRPSSEWKRHEVRRDRGLKAELNAEDALARHEFHLDRGYDLDEFGYVNIPSAFEEQYAEEIALELRLEELAELNNWDALVGNSYFSYDDYQEDEFLFDNHYSAEANAAWEEYQAQITPWLRKLPRRKTEEQQEAEYETWFLKRNRVPAEVEVLDDSPPVPPTGHRKSLAEKKLPVLRQQLFLRYESGLRQLIKKSSVGGVSKLEFKKFVNPPDENKRLRAETSERKRKEIRDSRKRKVAELSAMMD